MRRYGYDELVAAFAALDALADAPRRIVVIGGAAVAFHTLASAGTKDIDTWHGDLRDLIDACRARGIDLPPIGQVGVADFPYDFESRLERVLPQLERLEILVPEAHDLVVSKVIRWAPGDQDDIRELQDYRSLDKDILFARYLDETYAMGNQAEHDWNFVHCIDALFGEIAADEAKARVRARRH
jgi:hypothetical protein